MRHLVCMGLGAVIGLAACTTPPVVMTRPALGGDADTLRASAFGPRFGDARAVAIDPRGWIYVADAAADVVHRIDPDGALLPALGGPGSGDYAFLGPAGLDPTNGLVLFVADGGNGRIQRYSHEDRFLETIVVPADPEPLIGRRVGDAPRGRPVAVAASPAGEVYVAEEMRGVVLLWDDRRSLARVIGSAGEGRGALQRPVDLALTPDGRLLVADAGQNAVLVYDAFGEFLRRLADGAATDIRAVTADYAQIALILSNRVIFYGLDGSLQRALVIDVPEPLVGGGLHDGELILLSRTALWRVR